MLGEATHANSSSGNDALVFATLGSGRLLTQPEFLEMTYSFLLLHALGSYSGLWEATLATRTSGKIK